MSRKANRLKRRLEIAEQQRTRASESGQSLRRDLTFARVEIGRLKQQLENSAMLDGFRLAVRRMMPFERGYRNQYAMTMHMDMEAIKMGLLSRNGAGGNPYDLGSDIHYLSRQLAENAAQEIWKQLKADGVMI